MVFKRRYAIGAGAAAVFVAGMLALTAGAGASSSSGTVAWDSANTGNDFYISTECDTKAYAPSVGLNVKYYGSTPFAASAQLPVLDSIAATQPKGLILATTDTVALDPALKTMDAAGTKIIAFDNAPADLSLVDGFVTTNNGKGGAALADQVNKSLHGKGTVQPIDLRPGVQAVNERTAGFLAEIKKYPGIKVLPTQFDQEETTNDAQIVSSTLSANPNVSAFVPMYDQAAEGVVPELKNLGKAGSVKVFSMDADPVIVSWVKQGLIQAVVSSPPILEAQLALKLMKEALAGKKISPKEVIVPMTVITKANINTPAVRKEVWVSSCSKA